jgi:hypothetical protein
LAEIAAVVVETVGSVLLVVVAVGAVFAVVEVQTVDFGSGEHGQILSG